MADQPHDIKMATGSMDKPFPRTPYPFHETGTDQPADLASISDWLEISKRDEVHHPESNALTPEDWIACDGREDTTWVVGEPDWLEEGTKDVGTIPGKLSRVESVSSPTDSTTSLSDLSCSQDTNVGSEKPRDQIVEHAFSSGAPNESSSLGPDTSRGVVRRRSSGEELQLPERKRPRLERLVINTEQQSTAAPCVLASPKVEYNPTPISPDRQFYRILAEKSSKDGVMFKVMWRESWVHESKMPDVEPIRRAHYAQFGATWDVLPGMNNTHN